MNTARCNTVIKTEKKTALKQLNIFSIDALFLALRKDTIKSYELNIQAIFKIRST